MPDLKAAQSRIRELEAELQVRDDMGDEVLRILREATGKRDFHSEMEAAEYAAEIIRGSGWRPIAEAPRGVVVLVGRYVDDHWHQIYEMAGIATEKGFTHYIPCWRDTPTPPNKKSASSLAPPAREVENG